MREELKSLKSTAKSQETTISYFRKKIEELQRQCEDDKAEKMTL